MQRRKAQAADKRKQVRKVIKYSVNLCLFIIRQLILGCYKGVVFSEGRGRLYTGYHKTL